MARVVGDDGVKLRVDLGVGFDEGLMADVVWTRGGHCRVGDMDDGVLGAGWGCLV